MDDAVLWEAFARAFDAYDPRTKKTDDAKLSNLAAQWQDYISNERLESEDLVKELQRTLTDLKEEGDKPAPGPCREPVGSRVEQQRPPTSPETRPGNPVARPPGW